jgi:hypothetical protein
VIDVDVLMKLERRLAQHLPGTGLNTGPARPAGVRIDLDVIGLAM